MKRNCTACGGINDNSYNDCQYCGNSLNNNPGEIESIIKTINEQGNKFTLAEVAFEGENYDEAINYYNSCLEINPEFFEAWYKKGLSQLFSSTVGKLNSNQCVATLKKALNSAPTKDRMAIRISKEIIPFLKSYTLIIINHFSSFGPEHISYMVARKSQTTIFLVDFCKLDQNQLSELFEDYQTLHKGIKKAALTGMAARGGVDKNNSIGVYGQMYKEIELLGETLLNQVKIFNPQAKKVGKTDCFIATATLGNFNHPIVLDLRSFRDNWLLMRQWGINFTRWYYTYGPRIAKIIERNKLLRIFTYIFLIKPLHFIVKKIK